MVVVNSNSPLSRKIAEYYVRKRGIPTRNLCLIQTTTDELIPRQVYEREIAGPIAGCLKNKGLTEQIEYLVTTLGVPLGIRGTEGLDGDESSVDSELTLLYSVLHGTKYKVNGPVPNPFFGAREATFHRPAHPIYLVTRLAAYSLEDVQGMIDRSLAAVNRGVVVLDLSSEEGKPGNDWLRTAAILLPEDRVVFDESPQVLIGQKNVIGYASWGSNDRNRKTRTTRFQWLPGAIMTEYVSTNGRTFERPPETWGLSSWKPADQPKWFKGSPQTLIGDYLAEGVTGAAAHVFEPYLQFTPRPDHLFPAYLSGRTLGESFYLAIPALSWKNIVLGDPLCQLRRP